MKINHLWHRMKQSWRPQKLNPPAVDVLFQEMDGLERSVETIRYSILSWEFWASPNGQVREWCRHNTRLVVLFIPVLLIISMIGFALTGIAAWTIALTAIAGHIILIPVLVLLALLSVLSVLKLIKSIFC